MHVAESAFVEGACIPSISLETLGRVPFAIPTEPPKQMKSVLKK
jgi:hypothetical protein